MKAQSLACAAQIPALNDFISPIFRCSSEVLTFYGDHLQSTRLLQTCSQVRGAVVHDLKRFVGEAKKKFGGQPPPCFPAAICQPQVCN